VEESQPILGTELRLLCVGPGWVIASSRSYFWLCLSLACSENANSVSRDCCYKLPPIAGLQQHRFFVSQFWRPKAKDQVVHRASLPLKTLGEGTSGLFNLWFLDLWPDHSNLCLWLHMAFYSVCLSFFFCFLQRHLSWNLGPMWVIQDNLAQDP
jgi:hypothetical protein